MKSKGRIKQTGEVFTPTKLVQEILDKLPDEVVKDPTKTVLDPACGNGQFLIEVAQRRNLLVNIFGVDIMADNCCDTIARLIFWYVYGIHIFDHTAQPINLNDFDGHHDDHSYSWLREQQEYDRLYSVDNVFVLVRKHHNSKTGIWFEYTIDGKNWFEYPYIVCADSLQFDYTEFDNIQNVQFPERKNLLSPSTVQPNVVELPIESSIIAVEQKKEVSIVNRKQQDLDRVIEEIDEIKSKMGTTAFDFNKFNKLVEKKKKLEKQGC